jgi:amino acid transporter
MIGGRRPLPGRKPGDRRVRVARPHAALFRYTGPGQLVAKEAASRPTTPFGRFVARAKAILIGRPLASEEEIFERLSKKKALAIFSSDAISSSAYATEEILRILVVAGASALVLSTPIALAIGLMLAVVSSSYRQVCRAYPGGGGAYVVARTNLAPIFGLVAAAALLIDYIMTVAVSTASAVQQIQSFLPAAFDYRIEIAFLSIAIITLGNLRGIRESGNIFTVPTYLFVVLALAIVAIGLGRIVTGTATPLPPQPQAVVPGSEALTPWIILKAFAGGSVALTGVEAIANGVPAFKPPESRNAANTMTAMAILLGVIFVGVTIVAHAFAIVPSAENSGGPTVIALVATTAFGPGSPLFVLFQVATALILFLASNTSFNAFPRLAAILAEDGYFPRQFALRGDRLAYSWGIVLLAAIAFGLIAAFNGDVHALIPLYSVGVFVCFTLSQTGMVRHWMAVREAGWWWRAAVNAFGGLLTLVVLLVVASAKFVDGAWVVVVLIPILVSLMLFVHHQYEGMARRLALRPEQVVTPPRREERVIVPVTGINRAVVQAVNVARSIADDVRAVFVTDDPEEAAAIRRDWERQIPGVPLVVVESPYRALAGPLLAYLDVLDLTWPPDKEAPITFVVIPEYIPRHWWERLLYNQSTRRLRTILLGRPHTVVVNVPYRREEPGYLAPIRRLAEEPASGDGSAPVNEGFARSPTGAAGSRPSGAGPDVGRGPEGGGG